ncbi:MAG: class I SAM-dependent methyltransferase [candidate division Zixibacteria bacterium]|nr:class I SAM-dependent methyltransferase [candidate division Zixibacteria bacterium]
MSSKHELQEFFNGHAPEYMKNVFVKNTIAEVDFIIKELQLAPNSSILDVGCGTGRHSIELAKRGYMVTGIDISEGMLNEAEKTAQNEGVEVNFIRSNAVEFKIDSLLDNAICLCEGAFSLLAKDDDPIEHDLKILKNIYNSLNADGKLILTALNACKMIRKYTNEDVGKGKFDPVNMFENSEMEWDSPEGKRVVKFRERGYVATELRLLFKMAGFKTLNLWGGTAGNWGKRQIDLDEMEIMIIGEKEN